MKRKQTGAALLAGALLLLSGCGFSGKPADADLSAASASSPAPSASQAAETYEAQASSEPQAVSETKAPAPASSAEPAADEPAPEAEPDKGQEMRERIEALQPDQQAVYAYAQDQELALIPVDREFEVGTESFLTLLHNAGELSIGYAGGRQDYRLEKLVDGEWQDVPYNQENLPAASDEYTIEPYDIHFKYFDLTIWQARWMSAGQFRITQTCRLEGETLDLTFYFSLYGEGNPLDPLLEEAAVYGDQNSPRPDGGQLLLAPDKRAYGWYENYTSDIDPYYYIEIDAHYYNESELPVDVLVSPAFTLEKKEEEGWRLLQGNAYAYTPDDLLPYTPYEAETQTVQPYHQHQVILPLTAFDITQLTLGDYRISLYALGKDEPPLIFHFSLEETVPEAVYTY